MSIPLLARILAGRRHDTVAGTRDTLSPYLSTRDRIRPLPAPQIEAGLYVLSHDRAQDAEYWVRVAASSSTAGLRKRTRLTVVFWDTAEREPCERVQDYAAGRRRAVDTLTAEDLSARIAALAHVHGRSWDQQAADIVSEIPGSSQRLGPRPESGIR